MSPLPAEAAAVGAFALAFVTVLAATPVAIRVANRLRFYDQPGGYKVHPGATPYLGGAAVVAGLSLAALVFIGGGTKLLAILGGAGLLLAVGTVDDRRTVRPSIRILATSGAAALLSASGAGWSVFGNDAANLALTIVWVIGGVNAFNLMDNMDGAAATVAAVSGAGVAALAVINDDPMVAALALALSGACVGFLKYNLASSARIFLGDGGSMPIGFVLAAAVMGLPEMNVSGVSTLIPAALLVGLAIFDTTLVIVSRSRRRVRIYSGARDHVTHRLLPLARSPRSVVIVLAVVQTILSGLAIAAVELGTTARAILAISCVSIGGVAIWALEKDRVIGSSAPVTENGSVESPGRPSAVNEITGSVRDGAEQAPALLTRR
jgi:UDP-GlcNAc:undecaprenyl-phosphate/decaprenyl-phosphate GlcNAc-1-phosphate transferase